MEKPKVAKTGGYNWSVSLGPITVIINFWTNKAIVSTSYFGRAQFPSLNSEETRQLIKCLEKTSGLIKKHKPRLEKF